MKYGIFGAMIPVLVTKPAFEYLDKTVPGISKQAVKKEYKAIIARQPEIGGMKNRLSVCIWPPG